MPASTILRFTDPFEHERSVLNSEIKLLLTAPGDYQGQLTRIGLHQLFMQRGRESLPHVTSVALDPSRRPIFFLDHAEHEPFFHSGKEVERDHIVFCAPGAEFHHRTTAASTWAAMSLEPDDLAAAGRAIAGDDLVAPAVTRTIRAPSHLIARLRALHGSAGRLAEYAPDTLANPEVAKALEQELVRTMVRCLTEGASVASDRHNYRRLTVMQRFERTLNETGNSPRYLAEICTAIGVPERTLRAHCMEHLGMTPHRYLWLRRMHQARRGLALGDATRTTVTVIATDHGFWELGRFAGEYSRIFGELPSATLRRAPDPPARATRIS